MEGQIISERPATPNRKWARSSRIRERLPPESAQHQDAARCTIGRPIGEIRFRSHRASLLCSRTAKPALSDKAAAGLASTARRSEGLVPRSLTESRIMLSWRGAVDGRAGAA
jgi:hypothetical protein